MKVGSQTLLDQFKIVISEYWTKMKSFGGYIDFAMYDLNKIFDKIIIYHDDIMDIKNLDVIESISVEDVVPDKKYEFLYQQYQMAKVSFNSSYGMLNEDIYMDLGISINNPKIRYDPNMTNAAYLRLEECREKLRSRGESDIIFKITTKQYRICHVLLNLPARIPFLLWLYGEFGIPKEKDISFFIQEINYCARHGLINDLKVFLDHSAEMRFKIFELVTGDQFRPFIPDKKLNECKALILNKMKEYNDSFESEEIGL